MASVLLLALLPVAGNLAGGLLAETVPLTDRWLNRALHAAAGVVMNGRGHRDHAPCAAVGPRVDDSRSRSPREASPTSRSKP